MRQTKKLHGVFKSIESAVQSANRTRVNLAEKGRFSDASEKQEEENGSCTLDSDQYPSVLVFSAWPASPSVERSFLPRRVRECKQWPKSKVVIFS